MGGYSLGLRDAVILYAFSRFCLTGDHRSDVMRETTSYPACMDKNSGNLDDRLGTGGIFAMDRLGTFLSPSRAVRLIACLLRLVIHRPAPPYPPARFPQICTRSSLAYTPRIVTDRFYPFHPHSNPRALVQTDRINRSITASSSFACPLRSRGLCIYGDVFRSWGDILREIGCFLGVSLPRSKSSLGSGSVPTVLSVET
ncbi:hypothetical protein NMY22_g17619 [Coprinellus aureogranulatus]|nr:hypothetical protein NMY22_g17619 [Coprinellus aureogranulatus]